MQIQVVPQLVEVAPELKILEEYRNSVQALQGVPKEHVAFLEKNVEEAAPIFLQQFNPGEDKSTRRDRILGQWSDEKAISFMKDIIAAFGLDAPEVLFEALGILFSTPTDKPRFFRYEEDEAFAKKIDSIIHALGKATLCSYVAQRIAGKYGRLLNHGCHCDGHSFEVPPTPCELSLLWPSQRHRDRAIQSMNWHLLFELTNFKLYPFAALSAPIPTL
jgi:hypothetical protein